MAGPSKLLYVFFVIAAMSFRGLTSPLFIIIAFACLGPIPIPIPFHLIPYSIQLICLVLVARIHNITCFPHIAGCRI